MYSKQQLAEQIESLIDSKLTESHYNEGFWYIEYKGSRISNHLNRKSSWPTKVAAKNALHQILIGVKHEAYYNLGDLATYRDVLSRMIDDGTITFKQL